jgi:hypothetical protein
MYINSPGERRSPGLFTRRRRRRRRNEETLFLLRTRSRSSPARVHSWDVPFAIFTDLDAVMLEDLT